MRLAVPRVSLTTSPLRLQTDITSSSLSRVAINSVGDSFNRFCTTSARLNFPAPAGNPLHSVCSSVKVSPANRPDISPAN